MVRTNWYRSWNKYNYGELSKGKLRSKLSLHIKSNAIKYTLATIAIYKILIQNCFIDLIWFYLIYRLTSGQSATAVLPCQRAHIHTCKWSIAIYTYIYINTTNNYNITT